MAPNTGSALSSLECHLLFVLADAGAAFAGTFVSVLVTEGTSTSSSFFKTPMGLMRFARLEEGAGAGVDDADVTEGGSTLPGDLRAPVVISAFTSSGCETDGVLVDTGTGEDNVEGGERDGERGTEDDDEGTLKKLFALATSIY